MATSLRGSERPGTNPRIQLIDRSLTIATKPDSKWLDHWDEINPNDLPWMKQRWIWIGLHWGLPTKIVLWVFGTSVLWPGYLFAFIIPALEGWLFFESFVKRRVRSTLRFKLLLGILPLATSASIFSITTAGLHYQEASRRLQEAPSVGAEIVDDSGFLQRTSNLLNRSDEAVGYLGIAAIITISSSLLAVGFWPPASSNLRNPT